MKPTYQQTIERHYDAGLGLVTHFITELANQAIEIAAKGIALAAPAPNAIGIYNTTQGMGWHWIASLTFALSIEVCIFLMVEVSLQQWDGYLQYPTVYLKPLGISIAFTCVLAVVVMCLVYWLEVHKILTLLPVISLICFVGIGLKRWHEKNLREGVKGVKRGVKSPVKSTGADFTGSVKSSFTPRQETILQLLTPLSGSAVKDVNKSELARKVGVSRPTLNSELDTLQSVGKISMNGHLEVK